MSLHTDQSHEQWHQTYSSQALRATIETGTHWDGILPWALFTHLRKFLFLHIFRGGSIKILGVALIEAVNISFLFNFDLFFYQNKFTKSLESWRKIPVRREIPGGRSQQHTPRQSQNMRRRGPPGRAQGLPSPSAACPVIFAWDQ